MATLVAAIKAANLAAMFKEAGPFIIFAPTYAVFNKLPAGKVESLLSRRTRLSSPEFLPII